MRATRFRLDRWQEDLQSVLAGRTLQQVAMPGSHNSGTDSLSLQMSLDAPAVYSMIPSFIRRWSCCQADDVAHQLQAGVRYVDLRTARCAVDDDTLRVVHACAGSPVDEVLSAVAAFVQSTTHEIVIVDFQHFYHLTPEDHGGLVQRVEALFAGCGIIPPSRARATLREHWAAKQRVLVLYGSKEHAPTRPELLLERPAGIISPWAGDGHTKNRAARLAFKDKLEAYMQDAAIGRGGRLFALQCVSGPDTRMIVLSLLSGGRLSNLQVHALQLNSELGGWIAEWMPRFEDATFALNIVLLDFCTSCTELMELIVGLNVRRT